MRVLESSTRILFLCLTLCCTQLSRFACGAVESKVATREKISFLLVPKLSFENALACKTLFCVPPRISLNSQRSTLNSQLTTLNPERNLRHSRLPVCATSPRPLSCPNSVWERTCLQNSVLLQGRASATSMFDVRRSSSFRTLTAVRKPPLLEPPRKSTVLPHHLFYQSRIIKQDPLHNRERQTAVLD